MHSSCIGMPAPCRLPSHLKLALPGAVGASAAAAADGWLSAWLTSALPSQCAGLSASACAACAATPAPALCLSCMRDKRAQDDSPGAALVAASVVPPGSQGARVLDQCVTCAQAPGSALQQK